MCPEQVVDRIERLLMLEVFPPFPTEWIQLLQDENDNVTLLAA